MPTDQFIPIEEAVDKLQIALLTMYRWIVDGRLILQVRKDPQDNQKLFVSEESIRSAYKVKCIHCGKTFRARGPKRARYCSVKCRNAYQFQQRKLGILPVKRRRRRRRPAFRF